jgi:hypothetical protein
MTTVKWAIEFETGQRAHPGVRWATALDTSKRYWKRDLGRIKKAEPFDTYRVVKTVIIREIVKEA